MAFEVDLTRESLPSQVFTDEDSGEEIEFGFKRPMTRQARQSIIKVVGKGNNKREIVDFPRLFRTQVAWVGKLKGKGVDKDGKVTDTEDIIKLCNNVPAAGGLPESCIEQMVNHLLGQTNLSEAEGNI